MRIMINLDGTDSCKEFNLLQDNMSVLQLKGHLSKIYNIPHEQIELLLNDFPLNDKQIVNQVGIDDNLLLLKRKNSNLSSSHYIETPQIPNLANSNILISSNVNIQNPNLANSNRVIPQNPILANSNNVIPQNSNLVNSNRVIPQNPKITTSNKAIPQNPISNTPTPTPQSPNISNSNALHQNPILANSQNPLGLSESTLINDAIAYNTLVGISQDSPEAQRRIEKIIRQQRINDNLIHAAEYMPESLIPVHMLFINIEINNIKIPALVDTGAQSTFMSLDLCKKCGLINMCDKRFHGIAKGVGSSRIVGVIHAAEIKILNKIIGTKINVIENNEVGFVFGLDSLRAHRCNVDLKQNGLVFPDIGITAKFLSDGEISKMRQDKQLEKENDEIERAKKASLNYQ